MKVFDLISKLFRSPAGEQGLSVDQADKLGRYGFVLGPEALGSEPVSIDMNGRKPFACAGMPFDREKGRPEEVPSAGCEKEISPRMAYAVMGNYQFSWWDEQKRDPSQWTKIRMCIPCALEAGVIAAKPES
jgi:hypothetical protein